jgi:hypothetical protein
VGRADPARVGVESGLRLGGGGLGLQRVLRLLDQGVKRGLVANGDVGQDLAVELDVRGLEALDEAAVGDARVAAGRVEADDPQAAEFGLLLAAVAVSVLPGVLDRFLSVAEQLRFAALVALGVLQHFLAAAA